MANAQIITAGFYVPESVVPNSFFVNNPNNPYLVHIGEDENQLPIFKNERTYLTEDKIYLQTGMLQRRRISPGQTVVDLLQKAFLHADFPANKLEGIIIGTISNKERFPSVACRLQQRIGASNVNYTEDVGAACSGFTHALDHARLRVQESGGYYAVGAVETLSVIIQYEEILCNLFGDGGGIVILGPSENKEKGILATDFGSDTSGIDYIYQDKFGLLRMPKGPLVLKRASRGMVEIGEKLSIKSGIPANQIDLYIPHQANGRIIDNVEEKVDPQKTGRVYRNVHKYGNMSAATEAVALAEALHTGRLKKDQIAVLLDMGSGLAFGSALIAT